MSHNTVALGTVGTQPWGGCEGRSDVPPPPHTCALGKGPGLILPPPHPKARRAGTGTPRTQTARHVAALGEGSSCHQLAGGRGP